MTVLNRVMRCLGAIMALLGANLSAQAQESRIAVVTRGDGPPVVFIPGLTSSPRAFEGVIEGLPVEAHLVTLAGFGGLSAPGNLDPFISPTVDDLTAYLEAENLSEVSIVGHSMGGVIAMMTAAQSDRVSRVLVVDAVPFLPALFNPASTASQAEAMRPMMRMQMAVTADEQYLEIVRQGLSRQAISEGAREQVMADVKRSDISAAKAAFVELMTTDYTDRLTDIDIPITVLVPFDPNTGFPREALLNRYQTQYDALPTSSLRVVEDSRHFIMLDQPAAFRAELDLFLSEKEEIE